MPSNRKKTQRPVVTAVRNTRALRGKKVDINVSENEDEASTDNLSSRHPASSATTTATSSDTNATEDSNSGINRAATTTTTNVNNNGRVNTSAAAAAVNNAVIGGGITTRRSRSLSQAQKNSTSSSSVPPATAVITDDIIDLGELNLNLFSKKKSVNNEELLSKSSTSSEEESDPSNLVVISSGIPPPVRSEDEGSGCGQSPSNEEDESVSVVSSDGQQSYSIIVNQDGSLHLVDEGSQPELVPGQEQFSVSLPKSKVKSDNPLPGAVQHPSHGRIRKSKPEGTTYGAAKGTPVGSTATDKRRGDKVGAVSVPGGGSKKESTMSVGINQAHSVASITSSTSAAVPIDIDEFTNQLDPQSLATLENLIQSQQAREIIENLDLDHVSSVPLSAGGQKWDNHNQSMGSLSESASSVGGMTSPGSSAESSPSAIRCGNRPSLGKGTSTSARSRASTSSRLSESDGSVRRSLRQQDRIERQEAERIMAENQQMLQREKEIMQGALAPKPIIPIIAKKVDSPQTPPTLVAAPAVPTISKPALVGRGGGGSTSVASSRDSIDSGDSDRKPYPKRENRRLPAHLADPNYLSLEDEDAKVRKDNVLLAESEKSEEMQIVEDDYDPEVQEDAEDADEEYTEDDPNKLWCICHQPHNNRFMICCDTCEDWFHGKCVGVTKAQGKAMELKNILWVCPPCRKAEVEKKRNAKAAERASHTARRSVSGSGTTGNDSRRISKGAAIQQADVAAAAVASKMAFTPNSAKKGALKRNESRNDESEQGCVVCSKTARKDSIYCSDQCVQKYAETVGKAGTPNSEKGKVSPVDTPTSSATSSPTKLKRTNSKPDVKPSEPIFNFHVISSGASKSTEVAPPKSKEMTASQILKAQKELQSPTKGQSSPTTTPPVSVVGISPNSVTSIISGTPSVLVKKMSVKVPGKTSPDDNKTAKSRTRTSSQSDSRHKSQSSSNRKSDSSKSKEKEKDIGSSDKLHRESMRKSLREILKTRMKELPEDDRKKFNEGPNNPEALAEKIEDELCKTYGGVNTVKCKAKYRNIYFNLKAEKNLMFKELLLGSLKPRVLVKMETHEMASAELAEWRKKEAQKEIEAIKKAELDKITESKKIQLLEKGIDDAAKVAEELRPLDINDVIDQNSALKDTEKDNKDQHAKDKTRHHSSEKPKSSSHGHSSSSRRDRDKDSKDSKSQKDKHDKDRRRSDRHKDQDSSRDKDRRSSSHKDRNDKEKVKHSDNSHKDKRSKESESNCQVSSGSDESKSPQSVEPKAATMEVSSPTVIASSETVTSTPKIEFPEQEAEQPSSTIKTPDFVEDGLKKDSEPKHLFQTKIVMPELGSFHASAHGVSHALVDGVFFPKSPVPVVGRISPDTVWDYINKMKKSKEVIVFRLSPASPADSSDYMTFFSYFSSRSRLGVIGGIESPLKDVYLVPLPKQAPIPRCLLPFRGPGLPEERTHCLLCIVTRNIRDPGISTLAVKRKSSVLVDQPLASKKRVKLDVESDTTIGLRSRALQKKDDIKIEEDDDAPYTPWEDESTSSNSDSQPPILTPETLPSKQSSDVQKQLEEIKFSHEIRELEAKIAREKQDIEKITGALAGRSSMSGIPGLDGEFAEGEAETETEESSSSPPEIVAVTPPPALSVVPELSHISDPRLRRRQRLGADVQSVVPVVESPALKKTVPTRSPPEVMDLGSSDDSSSKDEPEAKVDEREEDAYSPSTVQFSDEETTDSQDKKKTNVSLSLEVPLTSVDIDDRPEEKQPAPIEQLEIPSEIPMEINDNEDDEPLPPGEEDPPTFKSAIVYTDDIKITIPKSSSAQPPQPASTIQQSTVDLDDFQPMRNAAKQEETKSESIFEQQVTGKSVASFKGSTTGTSSISTGGSKMKININLTTKQLPVADETKDEVAIDSVTPNIGASMTATTTVPPTQLPIPTPLSSTTLSASSLNIHEPSHQLQQTSTMPLSTAQQPSSFHHQQSGPIMLPSAMPKVSSIPLHIPPPNLLPPGSSMPPNNSVVINLNVPPPSFGTMLSRPPVPPPGFLSGFPPRVPFSSIPTPPPMPSLPRQQMGTPSSGYVPSFGSNVTTQQQGNFPGSKMSSGLEAEKVGLGRGHDSNDGSGRVQRVNLDRSGERDRPYRGREMRGRNNRDRPDRDSFPRRRTEMRLQRSPIERIRRRRSLSRDRSRSRSRSPRDRRNRKRPMSRSRSKSPLSRRWEARNRSRSPARRGRNKSRTPSPPRRRSRSPRRNVRRVRSPSPPSPLLRSAKSGGLPEKTDQLSDEDWEGESSKNIEPNVNVLSEEGHANIPNFENNG